MGVSGSGKSTLGRALAERLGWEFLDGDDFHPHANVAKMRAGTPLEDADRWPWLDGLNRMLREREARGASAVLACSALRQAHRDRLAEGVADCRFVFLKGSYELIESRLKARAHRYMPASLLRSQFETLEPPREAIEVDVAQPLERCVDRALAALA